MSTDASHDSYFLDRDAYERQEHREAMRDNAPWPGNNEDDWVDPKQRLLAERRAWWAKEKARRNAAR